MMLGDVGHFINIMFDPDDGTAGSRVTPLLGSLVCWDFWDWALGEDQNFGSDETPSWAVDPHVSPLSGSNDCLNRNEGH